MPRKLVNIRLDSDLWKQAKKAAIDSDKLLQDWITEAIKEKLSR